jgi:hypothetical protein
MTAYEAAWRGAMELATRMSDRKSFIEALNADIAKAVKAARRRRSAFGRVVGCLRSCSQEY